MTMMAGMSIVEVARQEAAHESELADAQTHYRQVARVCFRAMWLLVPVTVLAFYLLYKLGSPASALGGLTAGMLLAVAVGLTGVTATHRLAEV